MLQVIFEGKLTIFATSVATTYATLIEIHQLNLQVFNHYPMPFRDLIPFKTTRLVSIYPQLEIQKINT